MAEADYSYGTRLLRLDDGVLEVFDRLVQGSLRIPARFLGVKFEDRKNDELRVELGLSAEGEPFYVERTVGNGPLTQLDVPQSESASVRGFFDLVARESGRAV